MSKEIRTQVLELGTAKGLAEDGTWSIKLQIDNIPAEDVADLLADWLYRMAAEGLQRAADERKKGMQ